MNDLPAFGARKVGGDSSHPLITDWKSFYTKFLIPTFHHQPLVSRRIVTPTPIKFDGKTVGEIPTFNDIEDPNYSMTPKHKDTKIHGQVVTVPLPQFTLTTLLTDDEMKLPFAQRIRLKRWTNAALKKLGEFEDKKAFQGDSSLGVVGFIGANSKDLGAPTGVWDVDTGANGILNNAWDDIMKIVDYFVAEGLGERPVHIVMTSYMYRLLKTTLVLYSTKTNYDLIFNALPKGSTIMYSNNICSAPSATAATNKMVGFIELTGEDEGGYQTFASGVQQKVHKTDIWEKRYGIREKFSVRVVDDAYVAYMDAIDVST